MRWTGITAELTTVHTFLSSRNLLLSEASCSLFILLSVHSRSILTLLLLRLISWCSLKELPISGSSMMNTYFGLNWWLESILTVPIFSSLAMLSVSKQLSNKSRTSCAWFWATIQQEPARQMHYAQHSLLHMIRINYLKIAFIRRSTISTV